MKRLFTLATVLLLAGCQSAPPDKVFPPLTFPGTPFKVNVAEIRVENNAPPVAGDVTGQFPVPMPMAINQWVQQRLVAAGSTGMLVVVIEDASVKETKLQKTQGMKGFFTDDQDARYDGKVAVSFRIYASGGAMSDAEAHVNVERSRSINEKTTLAQREEFYHQLTQDIMTMFDAESSKQIRAYFANYLRW